jgi:sugar-specific transcriptional regulator TrmB
MLEKYLQDIGLTDKEAAVYLALIKIANSAVAELSKNTKIKRATVYMVLESLAKKGLVSGTTIGKKTHYQSEPPERLETLIQQQKIALDEKARLLREIIPQFKNLRNDSASKPTVKYAEGREGIVSLSEEFLRSKPGGGVIYAICPKELVGKMLTAQERVRYEEKRLKKNIKSRVIYVSRKESQPPYPGEERVILDPSKYPIEVDVAVYEDEIKISILGEKPAGIFIRSRELAETIIILFKTTYENLKKGPP